MEDDFNDLDRDLIPDVIDNCRHKANPNQRDADGDKVGDACDNCVNTPNGNQLDTDNDGMGNACDQDDDNDGCFDNADQNPLISQMKIGEYFGPLCIGGGGDIFGFEGDDSDRDGLRNCEDFDDDNDGIPDSQDPCPVGSVAGAIGGNGCRILRDCPGINKDWWRTCLGGNCVEYFVRFRDHINPDPTRTVLVDRFEIYNRQLYVFPSAGVSIANTARAIANVGRQVIGRAKVLDDDTVRVEIWRRATETEPAHLVAVVGDFDPDALEVEQTELGAVLAFDPGTSNTPPSLGATWHIAGDPATATRDLDSDGLPDGWELQHGLNPNNPADARLDTDGDSANNAQEYRAGTDPTSAASRLSMLSLERLPGAMRLQFVAPAGRRVQLERTSELGSGQWSPVGAPLLLQSESTTLTDAVPNNPAQMFYRLRLVE